MVKRVLNTPLSLYHQSQGLSNLYLFNLFSNYSCFLIMRKALFGLHVNIKICLRYLAEICTLNYNLVISKNLLGFTRVAFRKGFTLQDQLFITDAANSFRFNPSRPNHGRRRKIQLNFYFHTSLGCFKRFYEGLKFLVNVSISYPLYFFGGV